MKNFRKKLDFDIKNFVRADRQSLIRREEGLELTDFLDEEMMMNLLKLDSLTVKTLTRKIRDRIAKDRQSLIRRVEEMKHPLNHLIRETAIDDIIRILSEK